MKCPACSRRCRSLHGGICRRCARKDYSSADWLEVSLIVRRRDGLRCQVTFKLPDTGRVIDAGGCGRVFPLGDLQAAHIVPRADGGIDHPSNAVTLCRACHGRQTAGQDGGFGNRRRVGYMNAQLTPGERAARTRGRVRPPVELVLPGDFGED